MSTAATSQPQHQWEYMEITRKTEAFLVGDMNQLGAEGWELVSVIQHQDGKGMSEFASWTAFLKRPAMGQNVPKSMEVLGTAARKEPAAASTEEPEIFDFQS
jgi:hypothetical protein